MGPLMGPPTPHGAPYRSTSSVPYGTLIWDPPMGPPMGRPAPHGAPYRNTSSVPYRTPLWDPHGTPYGTPCAPTEGIQRVLREVGAETPSPKTPPVLWDPLGTPMGPPAPHGTPYRNVRSVSYGTFI